LHAQLIDTIKQVYFLVIKELERMIDESARTSLPVPPNQTNQQNQAKNTMLPCKIIDEPADQSKKYYFFFDMVIWITKLIL
jgi:hypothetical protein